MFKRFELLYIVSVFMLIISIILIINTMQREKEFLAYNENIQKTAVQGAAYAINLQLENKQKHVRLFIDEYSRLLAHLDRFPDDEVTKQDIHDRLQQRFPDFFAYTITDSTGTPKLLDIESLVGDACQNDLNRFSNNLKRKNSKSSNEVFIHPQADNYHYDVMVPLYPQPATRVFFASFYLDEIIDILKTHSIPGQSLMLVRQSVPDLIEVTREGARDRISRDMKLSVDERTRVGIYENIRGTDWRLVNLSDEHFVNKFVSDLWQEMVVVLVIVAIALLVLVFMLIRISNQRK